MAKASSSSNLLDRKGLAVVLGIFALALAVRLVYLYEVSKSPTFFVPIVDSAKYDGVARSLARGKEMSERLFSQSFFYPLFLSRVYFFSGSSIICAKLVQVLLGAAVCVLVCRLGQKLFDRWTGALAGVITALYGPLIFFESELLATGWTSFWSVVLFLVLLKAGSQKKLWIYFAIGLCGGLSVITRATFLPFFVAAIFWLAFRLRRASMPWKMLIVRQGFVLIGLLTILAPVAILSFYTTGYANPWPTSGPINLYIGNNPETAKTMLIRPGLQWRNLRDLPKQHGAEDAHQARQFFMRRFFNYVATEPLHFLRGLAFKTVQFFSSRELPRTVDMYNSRKYSRLFSAMTWKMHGFGFPFGVLLPLALLGLIRYWPRIPVLIVLFLVLYPSAIILVFVSARYRVPMVPVLAVLAAAGCRYALEKIKLKHCLRGVAVICFIATVALLSSIAGPFPAETFNYEAEMHYCVGFSHWENRRIEESLFHMSEALRLDPRYFDAHKTLGYILYEQGKPQEAINHFTKAWEINPESGSIHYYLGIAFVELGQTGRALEYLDEALSMAELSANKVLAHKIRNKIRVISTGKAESKSSDPPADKN